MEVSVVTPTYHRRAFIPALIQIYKNQTYPKENMEWIIMDDGRDKVEDLFLEAAKTIPNIRYIYVDEKMRIGAKRNALNREATAPIIIAMDDDDYYPPCRVSTVVEAFAKYPRVNLAGSSEMFMYYMDSKKIYSIGPYLPNHATNGTMAWRKRYSDTHHYDEYVTHAEEQSFLEKYKHPMIQLDPMKTILVVCHTENTCDKSALREEHLSNSRERKEKMKQTAYVLTDFIKENSLLKFYSSISP